MYERRCLCFNSLGLREKVEDFSYVRLVYAGRISMLRLYPVKFLVCIIQVSCRINRAGDGGKENNSDMSIRR